MWMLLVVACVPEGPFNQGPPPTRHPELRVPPAPEPVAVRPEPAPPRPEPSPLGEADPELVKLYRNANRFMPEDFMVAMNATTAMGPDALPSLLRMIVDSDDLTDGNRLFALCEAVQRLEVRDDRVAWFVGPRLDSGNDLVVSTCGQAVAHSLPVGSPDLPLVMDLIRDSGARCISRRNLAYALREPSVCAEMEGYVSRSGCTQQVGVYGLRGCADVEDHLLSIAAAPRYPKDVRETALSLLRDREPMPKGRGTYLEWVDLDDPSNGMASSLELLAAVGTADDLPLLERVVAEDPHGGQSIHAINARKAIRAIRAR